MRLQTMDEEAGHSDYDLRRHHRTKSENAASSPAVTLTASVPKRVRTPYMYCHDSNNDLIS